MTDHHPWTERLSPYLDGELDAAESAELEAHLDACADCRDVLRDLRAVVESSSALEDRPPANDLWPAIADRLGPRPDVVPIESGRTGTGRGRRIRRFSFTLPQIAAAAIALALASAGAVWLTFASPTGSPPAADDVALDASADDGRAVRFASAEAGYPAQDDYDDAVAELERVLEREADRLDSATVATIERSLETIDSAIDDAYRALADDPADPYLNHHMAGIRHQKLQLLRRAVDLARAET